MGYVEEYYRKWLLEKVIIECWTLKKCAKVLDRPHEQVETDFDAFLEVISSSPGTKESGNSF